MRNFFFSVSSNFTLKQKETDQEAEFKRERRYHRCPKERHPSPKPYFPPNHSFLQLLMHYSNPYNHNSIREIRIRHWFNQEEEEGEEDGGDDEETLTLNPEGESSGAEI